MSLQTLRRPDRDAAGGAGGRWARRVVVALPLALGLSLIGLAIYLLFARLEPEKRPSPAATAAVTPAERPVIDPVTLPRGSPTDPSDRVRPPAPPGLKRWVIEPLPEGWDPEIAAKIAAFFERIDFDQTKPMAANGVGFAWDELHEYLATLGEDALPTLEAILNAEPSYLLRQQILKGIGGIDSETSTFVLRSFLEKRLADLKARSEVNHTIEALGRLKNDTAFDTMVGYIDAPDVPSYYKDKFIIALGEHPRREERVDLFKTMMIESRDNNVRNHSAQALGKFGTANDLPELYDAYEGEKRKGHWAVRQTLLGTIGKIGHPSSIPFLEQEARFARVEGVRLSAANALRRIGTPAAWHILSDLAQTEPSAGVRGRIQSWVRDGR